MEERSTCTEQSTRRGPTSPPRRWRALPPLTSRVLFRYTFPLFSPLFLSLLSSLSSFSLLSTLSPLLPVFFLFSFVAFFLPFSSLLSSLCSSLSSLLSSRFSFLLLFFLSFLFFSYYIRAGPSEMKSYLRPPRTWTKKPKFATSRQSAEIRLRFLLRLRIPN